MKPIIFLCLVCVGIACSTAPTVVYLCDSSGALRYHYQQDCKGLSNCSYQIEETTLTSAKEKGKTLCGWEK